MAEPTIQLGGGNWAGKSDNLLGYYKEGERFYKQDFTFSRSTTGTYTDKDGYIQEMPYNLLQQSNQFDTTWGNTNSLESLDTSVLAPNGKYTAWKLQANSGTHYSFLSQTVTISGQVSFTVFMKKGTANTATMYLSESGNFGLTANLENGTITSVTGSNMVGSVESVGNGWYRFEIRHTTNDNLQNTVRIGIEGGSFGSVTYDGTENIYIYGAQLVKGTSAKTYFPTTTRLNMPRVSYLNNSNGSLILEPQRSNLVTYSSDFSNAYWTKSGASVTSGFTSPDGTANAFKLVESNSSAIHYIKTPNITVSNSTKHTMSFFAKKGERNIALRDGSSDAFVSIDLTNNLVLDSLGISSSIDLISNGWYKISVSYLSTSTICAFQLITLSPSYTSGSPWSSYQGDGTSGVYIYGAQLEAGSYATTLINTSGSSVTRNADGCELTNVADRINSSEGVLFAEVVFSDDNQYKFISLNSGSSANRVSLYSNSPTFISVNVRNSSGNQFNANLSIDSTINHKIALKYKENDFALWIDGQERLTDSSGTTFTTSTLSELSFDDGSGGSDFYGKAKQIQVYSTALSDTELATLTTL